MPVFSTRACITSIYKSQLKLTRIVVPSLCFLWYRLYHHPLSTFPGPRLAALTRWYSFYFEVIQHGAFLQHKTSLHKKYGDVVRVGPNELSFRSPRAYNDIYAPGSQFTKDPMLYSSFGMPKATVGLMDPKEYRDRRETISPFFSRRAITKLEYVVQEKVDTLVQRLLSEGVDDTPVNLFMAIRCATYEIITAYCLNYSPSALATPGFMYPFLVSTQQFATMFWVFKYFPIVRSLLMNPPRVVFNLLPENIRSTFEFKHEVNAQIDHILANPGALLGDSQRETIYHHLLGYGEVGHKHRALERDELMQEAETMFLAGSETVGNTCTVGIFHVLNNKDVLRRLVDELDDAWPNNDSDIPSSTLEKLPYLTAVLKESLRLSFGASTALPRIVNSHPARIADVLVPAGTTVSISSVWVHLDPTVFPDPHAFNPERWLSPDAKALESSLVSFSRGPRSCIGVNLAWHELYRIFGTVFRRVKLTLHDTTEDDFKEFDDCFVPIHRGRQLHVTVEKR